MNIIVAVDKNWAIGKDNHLLVSIPKDQKLFRDETLGKVVIMGRRDTGKSAGRTAALWPQNHRFDQGSGVSGERCYYLP